MILSPYRSYGFKNHNSGFTLFEVLIALAVFAIAVTGLALALSGIVETALQTRQRTLSRMAIESRLAYNMVDPPLSGERKIAASDNNGVEVEESMAPFAVKDKNGGDLANIYQLSIKTKVHGESDSLKILYYHQ